MVLITHTIAITIKATTINRTMAIDINHITEVMVGLIIRRDTTTDTTIHIIARLRSTIIDVIYMTVMVPDTIDSQGFQVRNIEDNYLILFVIDSFVTLQMSRSFI